MAMTKTQLANVLLLAAECLDFGLTPELFEDRLDRLSHGLTSEQFEVVATFYSFVHRTAHAGRNAQQAYDELESYFATKISEIEADDFNLQRLMNAFLNWGSR